MSEQEHIIETFTEMAPRYESLMNSELNRFWGVSYPEFVGELVNGIDFIDNQKLLDVATGTAFIPQFISKQGFSFDQFVGLDITFEMLSNAKQQIENNNFHKPIRLVCASAHEMPFKNNNFDIVICCLATHHMNVDMLLEQIYMELKAGGKFHIGDVGGSKRWKVGIFRAMIKAFAYIYFLFTENLSRARAESEAIANILTIDEWRELIFSNGFESVKTRELKSKRFWTPNPVILEGKKPMEAVNDVHI
ncbi:MAG: methyltransferase domain-containing protein [Pelolinea sp.]|nr:methyltransferase domain-containing protein [Pelolinea sp.]